MITDTWNYTNIHLFLILKRLWQKAGSGEGWRRLMESQDGSGKEHQGEMKKNHLADITGDCDSALTVVLTREY